MMMMMTICFNEATRLLERSRSRWQEEEQMLPISLNGANSASRRASEVPKKRKIIRASALQWEYLDQNLASTFESHVVSESEQDFL